MDVSSLQTGLSEGDTVRIEGRSGLWKIAKFIRAHRLMAICYPVDEFGCFDKTSLDKDWPPADVEKVSPA